MDNRLNEIPSLINQSQRIISHEIVLLATCQFLKNLDALSIFTQKEVNQVNEILADARELMPQYSEQLRSI